MTPEKFNPIERALVAAAAMSPHQSRQIVKLICESGMTLPVEQPSPEPTEGQLHYAKREKIIRRMKGAADRVLDYAKHETLRNCEKHFRENPHIKAAEGDDPTLAAKLAFKKPTFSEELLAALREESSVALGVAGQQLFDEVGQPDPFKLTDKQALKFLDTRANLLSNTPDEIHAEIMQTIQDGLEHGEGRRELMARISTVFDEISKGRAETIANTETAAAFNFAREKAMRKAGVTHKKWLHSMSPLIKEPRPTHLGADGQVRQIDEPFDIGGVPMLRPGDESAGPEEIINCHCVAVPVEAPIEGKTLIEVFASEGIGHPFHGNQYVSISNLAERIEQGGTQKHWNAVKSLNKQDLIDLRDEIKRRKLLDVQPDRFNWETFPAGRTAWKSWSRRSLSRNKALSDIQDLLKSK